MTVKEICENLGLGSVSDSSVPPTKTYCEKESEAFSRKLATRGNTPWKKSAHIILKDDKLIKTFLLEQWKVLTGNGKHSQSLYLPVKDKDGVYEKYDAWGDLVGTGQLEELLQLTAVDLEGVPAGAFAREGFNILVQKGFLTDKDITYLTSEKSGKDFKTHKHPVLKMDMGTPDDFILHGKRRYYTSVSFQIGLYTYYLCREWYAESLDPLKAWFEKKGLNVKEIIVKCKRNKVVSVDEEMTETRLQIIYYGAPGTGKSFSVNKNTRQDVETVRTTFHPDSDYSSFVGVYKPIMTKDGKISYEFVAQSFLKAYVKAWERLSMNIAQVLVIEEINRGNCAQIFGDLFQLLDRADNGWSAYPIDADNDLMRYLGKEMPDLSGVSCPDGYKAEVWEKIKSGEKLALPPNLYIWATMNTSDQSLFPIDSAFKRRWDWEYSPIKDCPEKDYLLTIGGSTYKWWSFVKAINDRIWCATDSEDKKLGYFFVKAKKDGDGKNVIDAEKFLNKVVFYLWNDVFKNSEPERAFKFEWPDGNSRLATFQNFFKEVDGTRDDDMLKAFLKGLGVKTKVEEDADGAGVNPPSSEGAVAQDAASASDAGGTPSDIDGSSSAETENVAVEPA